MVRKITSMLRICVRHFYTSSTLHSTFLKKVFFQYCPSERTIFSIFLFKKQQCIVRSKRARKVKPEITEKWNYLLEFNSWMAEVSPCSHTVHICWSQTNSLYFQKSHKGNFLQGYKKIGKNHFASQFTLFLKARQGHKPKESLIKVDGRCRSETERIRWQEKSFFKTY